MDSIPGLARSPGEGDSNPPQYSCLKNPMDRGAWQATVLHGFRHDWPDLACMHHVPQYSHGSESCCACVFTTSPPWPTAAQVALLSHSVVSDSLWLHELQHTRLSCPLPPPGVYSNSCTLSQWCHPTISSSVVPFSSCFQSFPISGFFQMNLLFTSVLEILAKVLELQFQHQSFQWIFRTDFL